MAVVIINPNSTGSMTEAMLACAQDAVPAMEFEGWTSTYGPPSIQGRADGAAATPPLLDLVRKADAQNAEGIIIGCFDDTALREAASIARCPVIGIGQAAYLFAALRNWPFSVVTTLPVSVPILEENIRAQGLAGFMRRVRASNVPVLALEDNPQAAEALVLAEAETAAREDGISALILGCAGMVSLTEAVTRALPIPVLDPVVTAARCMGWILSVPPR